MTFVSSYIRRPPTRVYLVIQIGEQWWVDLEGKSYGPCESKEDAEASAFKLIQLFGGPERRVEVWSPDGEGKMRLVWKGKAGGLSGEPVALGAKAEPQNYKQPK